jgi:GNAT superfamily N-acetyltransferase
LSSYRFCRSDDIGLLVDALNRCWLPHVRGEAPVTTESFKRSIRDLQVWCSSCMVAFSGPDPIGVLIGAKRPSGTLIHRIAVHPDHLRQGHGRHLLTSLSSKLAILGPPRIVAEVPESLVPACALFSACGYVEEALLTDYVLEGSDAEPRETAAIRGTYVIPVTVDDLTANGLLEQEQPQLCWKRSVETVTARKSEVEGVALASDERIETYLLYIKDGLAAEVFDFRSFFADGSTGLPQLVAGLVAQGIRTLSFPKVHPSEISIEVLETLGFRSVGGHRLYAARAGAG